MMLRPWQHLRLFDKTNRFGGLGLVDPLPSPTFLDQAVYGAVLGSSES
jgi:hypothetical protein